MPSTKVDLDAEARQQLLDDPAAGAEEGARRHHVVAGAQLARQRRRAPPPCRDAVARAASAPSSGARRSSNMRGRGVAEARVDEAGLLAGEARLAASALVIGEALGEEQRLGDLAVLRAQRAVVHKPRLQAEVGRKGFLVRHAAAFTIERSHGRRRRGGTHAGDAGSARGCSGYKRTMNQNATPPGSIAPAHHDLDLADELLIDAEADDVGVQSARPAAHLLWIALGLVCVAFNLRPALSSIAPVLVEIRRTTGLSATMAGVLTTAPVLCLGVFGPLAPRLARRISFKIFSPPILKIFSANSMPIFSASFHSPLISSLIIVFPSRLSTPPVKCI